MDESMDREEAIASIAQKLITASEKVSGMKVDSAQAMDAIIDLDSTLKGILEAAKDEISRYDIEVQEVMAYMKKKRPDVLTGFEGELSTKDGIIVTTRTIPMDDEEKYIFKSAPREIKARIINGLATGGIITLFKHAITEFGAMPCVCILTVEEESFKLTQAFQHIQKRNSSKTPDFEKAIEALLDKQSEDKQATIEIRRVFADKVRMIVRVRDADNDLEVSNIHYFKCSEDGEDMSTDVIKSFDDSYAHNKWVSVQICEAINKDDPEIRVRPMGEPKPAPAPSGNKFKNRLNEMGD
jgi:hypothetical protein